MSDTQTPQVLTPSSSAVSPASLHHTAGSPPRGRPTSLSKSASATTDVPRFRPRACARCSVSKLKCNWPTEPGEAPCERMRAAKSEAARAAAGESHGAMHGATNTARRVGQLEQKIDGIMSLLTASKQIQRTSTSTTSGTTASTASTAPPTSSTSPASQPAGVGTNSSTFGAPVPALSAESLADDRDYSGDYRGRQDSLASSARAPSASSPRSPESMPTAHSPYYHQRQTTQQPVTPGTPASPPKTSPLPMPRDTAVPVPPPSTASASQQGSLYRLPHPQSQIPRATSHSRQLQLPPYPPPPLAITPSTLTSSLPGLLPPLASSLPPPPPAPSLRVPPLEHIEVAPGLKITFHDADLALAEYRKTYSPHFPFVPLSPDVSAYDLFQSQPFLFRVIVLVAYPQSAQIQRGVKQWCREQVAQHVVVGEKKDVSLLQVIILYVAWFDLGFYIDPKVTPLLQLAVGLVHDLGLHRPPHEFGIAFNSFLTDAMTALRGFHHDKAPAEHSLQDMRAMLGCYYVCALTSSLFRRTPVFPFTSYMDMCCDRLLAEREFPSDVLVVALARMHRLSARIHMSLPNPEVVDKPPLAMFAPINMAMASLRKELDAYVHSQQELKSNCMLWTHYYSILMRLYEPTLYLKLQSGSKKANGSSNTDLADTGLRTEALWNCLQATKDFFSAYAAVPTSIMGVLPLLATAQLSFGIVTLTHLLSLDDPEWHTGQARRIIDFAGLALQLEQQFRAADEYDRALAEGCGDSMLGRRKRYAVVDSNRSFMAMHSDKMRWIRIWYTTRMPPDLSRSEVNATSTPGQPPERPPLHHHSQQNQPADGHPAHVAPGLPSATQQQPLQYPITPQQPLAPPPPSQEMMDVDTDKLPALPDGLVGPPDEFDAAFWKALFDFDGSWELNQIG